MAHPYKDQSILSAENKHRQVVGQTSAFQDPYKKGQRISGTVPKQMEPVPEIAVPQFEIDRSPRDPVYGSVEERD